MFLSFISTKMPKYMQRTLDAVTERHYQKIVIWVVLGYIKHHIAEKKTLFFYFFLRTKTLKRVENNFFMEKQHLYWMFFSFFRSENTKIHAYYPILGNETILTEKCIMRFSPKLKNIWITFYIKKQNNVTKTCIMSFFKFLK